MTISKEYLLRYGKSFEVITTADQLDQILNQLQQPDSQTTMIYLLDIGFTIVAIPRNILLILSDEWSDKRDNFGMKRQWLQNQAPPVQIIDESTTNTIEMQQKLRNYPDVIFIITEQESENVLAVLSNMNMSYDPTVSMPVVPTKPKTQAQMTIYYPQEVEIEIDYTIRAYVYRPDLEYVITQNVDQFEALLDSGNYQVMSNTSLREIGIDTPLVIELIDCNNNIKFKTKLAQAWNGEWLRFDFSLRVPSNPYLDTIVLEAHLLAYNSLIAHARFEIPVGYKDENPLYAAKKRTEQSVTTESYRKIFCSYSRKDSEIVYYLAQLQKAFGDDVFIDVHDIRNGADWQASLALAIDEADIFQLFWSENSRASVNVCHEYEYALNYKCHPTQCRGVLRGLFWTEKCPTVPESLNHLNFKKIDVDPLTTVTSQDTQSQISSWLSRITEDSLRITLQTMYADWIHSLDALHQKRPDYAQQLHQTLKNFLEVTLVLRYNQSDAQYHHNKLKNQVSSIQQFEPEVYQKTRLLTERIIEAITK